MEKKNAKIRIRDALYEMCDEKYASFQAGLLPTLKRSTIIGARIPTLRKYAKEIFGTNDAKDFLVSLPHNLYDENNLHALLICREKTSKVALSLTDSFLPYVDNWATCDMLRPRAIADDKKALLSKILIWLKSSHPYTVRFAIEMLMLHFLEDDFSEEYPTLVAKIVSEEYYVNMMRAWYFAEALSKRYDSILPYLTSRRLDEWTHNKTISKAIESFKISKAQKELLRSLR